MIFNLGGGAAAPKLTSLAVTTLPTKTAYEADSAFDPGGMIVTAYFDDGSSTEITDYTYVPAVVSLGTDSITVTFTADGITKSAAVAVSSYKTIYRYNVVGSLSETFNSIYDAPDSEKTNALAENGNYNGIYMSAAGAAWSDCKSGRAIFTKTPVSIPAGAIVTYNVTNSISGSGEYSNTVFANVGIPTAIKFSPSICKNITESYSQTDHALPIETAGDYYLGFRVAEWYSWSTSGTLHSIVITASGGNA